MHGLNVLSIGLIGIIFSGCLSSPSPYTKQVVKLTKGYQETPSCNNKEECTLMWGRANIWLNNHSKWKIQVSNDYIVNTYNVHKYDPSYSFTISKEPINNNSYEIKIKPICGNHYGCDLKSSEVIGLFNKYLLTVKDEISNMDFHSIK